MRNRKVIYIIAKLSADHGGLLENSEWLEQRVVNIPSSVRFK